MAHLAVGDLLRQEVEKKTELGMKARSYMEKGVLAPDSVVIPMVIRGLEVVGGGAGVILDGFPRNLKQAEALDNALGEERKVIDKVVYIKVSEEELIRRLSGRRICRSCQAPYHVVSFPPRREDSCDKCGGELYQRPDDVVEAVTKRLEVYGAETKPLIDYYAGEGKLLTVDGEGDAGEVAKRIITALRQESA